MCIASSKCCLGLGEVRGEALFGVEGVSGFCSWFSIAGKDLAVVMLPGKGNPNFHGAMPVHLIITMMKWTRTSRLSKKSSLSL